MPAPTSAIDRASPSAVRMAAIQRGSVRRPSEYPVPMSSYSSVPAIRAPQRIVFALSVTIWAMGTLAFLTGR